MGQSALPLPAYECRILDRNLKVVRAFALICLTDHDAQKTGGEVFLRQEDAEILTGFEIWKDQYRLSVYLTQRPGDLDPPGPQKSLSETPIST